MESIKIIGCSVAAAVVYGIVHDQITARICVEYFTIGHPPVFGTEDPTLLGLGWGIIATWWAGLMIGVPLAIAARLGASPKRTARSLLRPMGKLLIAMALMACLAGLLGYFLASRGDIVLFEPLARMIPRDRHVVFLTDLWAHNASYLSGFLGGIVLSVRTWRSRSLQVTNSPQPA